MPEIDELTTPPQSFIKRFGSFPDTVFHEPPIGTGGSSLFLDIPENVNLENTATESSPFVYTFRDAKDPQTQYSGIGALLVITEKDDGFIDVVRYLVPKTEGAKLHLWLSNTSLPDFILEESGTERKLTISEVLDAPILKSSKRKRPQRRFCSDSGVHIMRWALVGSGGNVIRDPLTGSQLTDAVDDSYHFYISFHHH